MAKTDAAADGGQNGHDEDMAKFEQDLADYLQERMKPGLNLGAIPLLARSIAKDLAHRSSFSSASDDAEAEDEPDDAAEEEPTSEADDEPSAEAEEDGPDAEAEDEPGAETEDEPDAEAEDGPDAEEDDGPDAEADDEALDFEDEMHQLQAEFGEDWILRFSVQGGDAWLTAEKADGSQRLGGSDRRCARAGRQRAQRSWRPLDLIPGHGLPARCRSEMLRARIDRVSKHREQTVAAAIGTLDEQVVGGVGEAARGDDRRGPAAGWTASEIGARWAGRQGKGAHAAGITIGKPRSPRHHAHQPGDDEGPGQRHGRDQ
jgi:hypothetical protein